MKQTNYILNSHCVMISDLHLGSPIDDRLEDFNQDETFERLLLKTIPESLGQEPVTLVIAGDFIDFPQVLPTLSRHSWGDKYGTTEEESYLRMKEVIAGHPRVFSALNKFIATGGQALFIPGNHDIDLIWPKVFTALKQAIDAEEPSVSLVREGFLFEKRIYIEHGNQYSLENKFVRWPDPILDAPDGRQRLERAWGTLFLDLIYNDIEDFYPFVNKVYPLLDLVPIILRSIVDLLLSPKIPARFLAFWLLKGKRILKEWALGEGPLQPDDISDSYSIDSICHIISKINPEMPANRTKEIAQETLALLENRDLLPDSKPTTAQSSLEGSFLMPGASRNRKAPNKAASKIDGLLGRTNKAGLAARQNELLESGEITVVAFGHTHTPIDGNDSIIFGDQDPRRAFNTGSWMPKLLNEAIEHMTLADLKDKWPELKTQALIHDIRYLLIEFGDVPTACLKVV